ncbi:hypothetical protein [Aureivirga sp. CE67]|uniref:hypothetical protein n=1 Tax=Aureivirga sp. CE67 TaxID=1788983 RepID=UPI0018C98F41|nr:hypothetical protein [Aureivirga sp. CE67]
MSDIKKQLSELGCSLPVSATTEMKASIKLVEMYGKVRIIWDIDSRYPIQNAVAQVSQSGNTNYINHLITSHQGYFDTEYTWGRGYYGNIYGWNKNFIHILSTAVTS